MRNEFPLSLRWFLLQALCLGTRIYFHPPLLSDTNKKPEPRPFFPRMTDATVALGRRTWELFGILALNSKVNNWVLLSAIHVGVRQREAMCREELGGRLWMAMEGAKTVPLSTDMLQK